MKKDTLEFKLKVANMRTHSWQFTSLDDKLDALKVMATQSDIGEEITDIETDPDFYYEHVYMQPFCDQYTWLICNDRPELLSRHEFMEEYLIYKNTKKFCGKMCAPVFIEVPEHLKNK